MQATLTEDATVTALNKEQLTQAVAQQQHTWDNWFWSNAATILSSFLSTLVIVIGALFGLWRWRTDRRDAQDKELKDRQNERDKRVEERFQAVVSGLGAEKEGVSRVSAAIRLRTFLHPGYEQFYAQTFDLAVAHLQLPIPDQSSGLSLNQALIIVFKEAFLRVRDQAHANNDFSLLNAVGIKLDNAYLFHADLKEAMMPQASLQKANLCRADLSDANLAGARLAYAELREADLSDTNLAGADLGSANLSETDLSDANLTGATLLCADLMDPHLQGADLTGADLRNADLIGVDFKGIRSLKDTDLRGVRTLTKEQREACKAKGAIVDEDPTTSSSQSTAAPLPPAQSNYAQPSLTPSAQGSTPSPDLDGNNPGSPQQEPEL